MDDLRYQLDMLTAMNKAYATNEKIYKLICEASKRVFIYYQPSTGIIKSYGHWNDYFDFPLNDYSDLLRTLEILDEEEKEKVHTLFFLEKEGKNELSYTAKLKDGSHYIEIHSLLHKSDNDSDVEKLISFADVTDKKNLDNELSFMAYYDSVTGLYNRNYYVQKVKELLESAKRNNTVVAILMIDIDDFHKINDGLGIIYGDEVIQNFGIFLRELTCDNIIASRFDGDFYSLAIYSPVGNTSVDHIYNTIKERLANPFILTNGSDVSFTVSVGVSEFPESGSDVLELINGAEIVMLKAKDSGKDTIRYFDSSVLTEFKNSISIENKLKLAVNDMSFFLNFQPQYCSVTHRLRGVETLIRWKDSEGKLISPAMFIPIAERSGAIISIGDWVLDRSISTFMEWKRKFNYDMILSVNISSIQYKRNDFVNKVISTINKYEMNPEELELEITESVLIDDLSSVFAKMDELRDFGVKISIDDFGTGFSSLSYLKDLPADTLKIDKSFIDTIISDYSTKIIVSSIIDMSKKLGYKTVAEGVETKDQLNYLEEIGCDIIQGYYLGKPVLPENIEELLLRLI